MSHVPPERIRAASAAPVRRDGEYVLVWTTAFRRTSWNFTLDRAVEWSRDLHRPILVLEALRAAYPHASDRLHAFVLQGMADSDRAYADAGIAYHPYVEPAPGAGRGLLAALAARACLVVTDDAPFFFLPRMLAAAAERLPVLVEAVDGNGLLPVRLAPTTFPTAYAFRRYLQVELPERLSAFPSTDPLDADGAAGATIPDEVSSRWPRAAPELLAASPAALRALPIDHGVAPVADARGGSVAGRAVLSSFIGERLQRYLERSNPDADGSSGLSPWIHFGQVSTHEVFRALARHESWKPARLGLGRGGKREGFWGMSPQAESFLDELVTWREVGFNMLVRRPEAAHDFESLPPWAIRTLDAHAGDRRDPDLRPGDAGAGGDPRRGLERRAARAARAGAHPQLHAHALGQEDPPVERLAAGGARDHAPPERPLGPRRAGPRLGLRHLLVPGALRPALGAGAPRLRGDPLHVVGEHGPEAPEATCAATALRRLRP